MDRYVLSDAQWAKMQPHCLGKKSDPGRSGEDNRRFVEAVLWIARTGSPWRDLPMAERGLGQQAPAARRAAVEPGHLGAGAGLVDKDELVGIDEGLRRPPDPAPDGDVRTVDRKSVV